MLPAQVQPSLGVGARVAASRVHPSPAANTHHPRRERLAAARRSDGCTMVSCSPVAAIVLDPLESHGPKPAAEDPGKHCNLAPGERRNRKENTGPSPPVPVLDAPPQHASVVQVEGARFRDKPVDACLKALAMVHSANRTGFLDWFESSTATGQPLDKICDAFCDNIMCRVAHPLGQVAQPTPLSPLFDARCRELRAGHVR